MQNNAGLMDEGQSKPLCSDQFQNMLEQVPANFSCATLVLEYMLLLLFAILFYFLLSAESLVMILGLLFTRNKDFSFN